MAQRLALILTQFLLSLLLQSALGSTSAQEASALFGKARQYQQESDLQKAEELYLRFLKLAPGSAEAHANLGVVYAQGGKLDLAIREYHRALQIDPSLLSIYLNLGIAYFRKEDFARATGPLRRFLRAEPNNTQAHQLLGISYVQLDRYPEAIEMLAPLRASGDPGVLFALAASYVRTGQMRDAQQVLETLLTSEPDSPRIHFLLGQTYLGMNQFPQGLKEFQRLYELDPQWPHIRCLLGGIKAWLGFEDAEKDLRAELIQSPDSFLANFVLGALLGKQARYDEAIRLLERAKKSNPRDSDTLYELGRAYWKKGHAAAKALDNVQAAVKANTRNRRAHYLLAQIARQNGDEQTAQREFRIAESLSEAESGRDILRLTELSQKREK